MPLLAFVVARHTCGTRFTWHKAPILIKKEGQIDSFARDNPRNRTVHPLFLSKLVQPSKTTGDS